MHLAAKIKLAARCIGIYKRQNLIYKHYVERTKCMNKWIYAILTLCFTMSSMGTAYGEEQGSNKTYIMSNAALAGQESLECNTAKVIGIVLDTDTQKPVQGARIMVDGVHQVSTGKDGKFLMKSVRNGIYHWQVRADGYRRADYWNYSVYEADQKDIFTFLISKKKKISKDGYPLHAGMQEFLWEDEDSKKRFSKTLEQALQRGRADDIRLESVSIGNFTGSGEDELLAVFVFDSEIASGLVCRVAAVFNKSTKKVMFYVGAAGNTVDIYLMPMQNGADCLLFSWTSTKQGHSSREMKAYQMQMEKDRMKAVPLECLCSQQNI